MWHRLNSAMSRATVSILLHSLLALLWLANAEVYAQRPFVTDDAEVAAKRKFHFEFANEFDLLPRSSFPNLKQDTADFELDYGLFKDVEIGAESPLIAIFNAKGLGLRTAFGVGDTNLHLKYKFWKEREGSRLPAMAVGFNVEIPTGDQSQRLGSGLTDYALNVILQKSLTRQTTLRINGGLLFAGDTTTGVIGIVNRGRAFTGSTSIVRRFTEKLALGAEVAGVASGGPQFKGKQLQFQLGGHYALREGFTLNFGVIGGRSPASPRVGAQLGVAIDF